MRKIKFWLWLHLHGACQEALSCYSRLPWRHRDPTWIYFHIKRVSWLRWWHEMDGVRAFSLDMHRQMAQILLERVIWDIFDLYRYDYTPIRIEGPSSALAVANQVRQAGWAMAEPRGAFQNRLAIFSSFIYGILDPLVSMGSEIEPEQNVEPMLRRYEVITGRDADYIREEICDCYRAHMRLPSNVEGWS